jgi:L-asparagine transporter-like permease
MYKLIHEKQKIRQFSVYLKSDVESSEVNRRYLLLESAFVWNCLVFIVFVAVVILWHASSEASGTLELPIALFLFMASCHVPEERMHKKRTEIYHRNFILRKYEIR